MFTDRSLRNWRSTRLTWVLTLLVSLVLSSSAFGAAKIGSRLQQQLVNADPNVPLQVVVSFNQSTPITTAQLNAVKALGVKGFAFQKLPIMGVLATPAQISAIAQLSGVRSIYDNYPIAFENNVATAMTGADRLQTDINLTTKNGGLPVSGKGAVVLVNDSGIDGTHGDLQYGSKVIQNVEGATNLHAYDTMLPITYIEGVPNTDLGGGHGTHVAGTVAGTGLRSGGKHAGVAPGASLIGYGSGATLLVLDTLGGFDYALVSQPILGTRVITNSWGSTGDLNTEFDPDDPTNIASKACNDHNIVVVFSAGNSGPIEATISGNFKKAPWVISVANVDKQGKLAESSSRGVSGRKGTVTYPDGTTMTWEDRPTVAAPGTDIISTRASTSSLQALSAPQDAELPPAEVPFYTYMSGTSMAAPHVAGVVALMLDANPALNTWEVKQIIQQTATNLPGYETWELGAGLVNAYAAVDRAFQARNYGTLLNSNRTFHANAIMDISRTNYTIDFNPVKQLSPTANRHCFDVPAGLTALESWFYAGGPEGQTGNTLNLDIYDPAGVKRASSGIYVLFPLYYDRAVQVLNPQAGNWCLEVTGLKGAAANPTAGVAVPETINGIVKMSRAGGYTGLNDIAGHPAESAIKMAVNERLVDGYSDRFFRPDQKLSRIEMASYLTSSTAVRQYLPTSGLPTFADVTGVNVPFAEAVAVRGSNTRDVFQQYRGVMLPRTANTFAPNDAVKRWELAYSLVQALGLEAEALALNGQQVTVAYGDSQRIPVDDASQIPAGFEGYVQIALDMNLMNAQFSLKQGPFDLQPTIHATFSPAKQVTRAEYAVDIVRYYGAWFAPAE